ncbi:MAG TPA: hypothetical protein VFX02_08515 [Gammaproteobacteria bacterium]|nr:hypothetical protein [Gammaproteobacteria bacterium]
MLPKDCLPTPYRDQQPGYHAYSRQGGITRIDQTARDFSAREQLQNNALEKTIANAKKKTHAFARLSTQSGAGKVYKTGEIGATPVVFAEGLQAIKRDGTAESGKQKIQQEMGSLIWKIKKQSHKIKRP